VVVVVVVGSGGLHVEDQENAPYIINDILKIAQTLP
jgi:hypothetical protein